MGKKSQNDTEHGCPTKGFPIAFEWHTGDLYDLFEKQVDLLKFDVQRARAADLAIVYLSCPISSRGGGYHGTNVDIAKHTERRLMDHWGHRFWILNPARYQMESKEGKDLMHRHARDLGISDKKLQKLPRPSGGDYMRMWTRVLVEDGDESVQGNHVHLGRNFDAFYFLGPSDVRHFFSRGGAVDLTAGVEEYFARKLAMDPDFRDHYSVPEIEWEPKWETDPETPLEEKAQQKLLRDDWEQARKWFFRFYTIRASANFSLGCHDEWNIFRVINELRLANKSEIRGQLGDVGDLLSGFFDGRQLEPGSAASTIAPGYAYISKAASAAASENSSSRAAEADDEEVIIHLRETAADAYRNGDIEALLECWDSECVYMLPNEPAHLGKDAIRRSYETVFKTFRADIEYTDEVLQLLGDHAIGRFESKTTLHPINGGDPWEDTWKGLHVYRRQADGSWRYTIVIGNSNNPAPESD